MATGRAGDLSSLLLACSSLFSLPIRSRSTPPKSAPNIPPKELPNVLEILIQTRRGHAIVHWTHGIASCLRMAS
jgi:hypothetical protein